jgi:4-amino-4-deoxy-L-arabinose transferase-like glycosyltransferase
MESLFEKLAAKPQRSILFLSLVLLLAGNWILPLTDRDETRFAEASREMLQRGDFVVPWFNGAWRFDKPVLIYWCQIASYKILGVNDFAARLPSVLFTTAAALLLVRWGRKIADAKTAFLAGAMFVAGLHVAIIGRVATADMAMVFFVTLAVWSGWELTRPENASRKMWWWIFYVTLALGFLAKGPVAWLPLGGMVFGRVFRKNSFRLPLLETVVGLIVTMALAACWGIPALVQTGGKYFDIGMGEHVFKRAVAVNDSHGLAGTLGFIATLPVYFVTFFVSFFPWSTRLPSETHLFDFFDRVYLWLTNKPLASQDRWVKFGQNNSSYRDQLIILAIAMRAFASLAFVPSRLWRWRMNCKNDNVGWYLLTQAALVFVVFSCVRTKLPHYTMPAFPCIALWLALQISRDGNSFAWFGKRFAAMTIFILVLMLGFFSVARNYLLTENLWREVKPLVRAETKVGCFGYTEPSLVWKFRSISTNLVVLGDAKLARNFLTNTPPFILVLPTKDVMNLTDTNGLQIQVHGLDMVKFKNWDLTVIVR